MKINIDYKRPAGDEAKASNQEVTANYISFAIDNAYPSGADSLTRRNIARIQRKIDDAVSTAADSVDFDKAEFDLIRDAFSKAKFPPGFSKFVVLLEDEIAAK